MRRDAVNFQVGGAIFTKAVSKSGADKIHMTKPSRSPNADPIIWSTRSAITKGTKLKDRTTVPQNRAGVCQQHQALVNKLGMMERLSQASRSEQLQGV